MGNEKGTEKILNLILEIIWLLTGEECVVVKKNGEQITDGVNQIHSPKMDPPPNSSARNRAPHLPITEVPLGYEGVSVCLSPEGWKYTARHKGSAGADPDVAVNNTNSELRVEEILMEPDTSAVCNRNTPEIHRWSAPNYTDGDNVAPHNYQVQPAAMMVPHNYKEEEIPTEIIIGESADRIIPPKSPILQYQTVGAEHGLTQNYQIEPTDTISQQERCDDDVVLPQHCREDAVLPPQCKMEEIPEEIYAEPAGLGNQLNTSPTYHPNLVHETDLSQNAKRYQREHCVSGKSHNLVVDTGFHSEEFQNPAEFPRGHAGRSQALNRSLQGSPCAQPITSVKQKHAVGRREFRNNLEFTLHLKSHSREPMGSGSSESFANHSGFALQTMQRGQCVRAVLTTTKMAAQQCIQAANKGYVCPTCGKGFSQKSDLIVHQRIHTGEKPFVCSDCGKSFTQRGHRTSHMRSHTGEKPFSCAECGKRFTRKSTLIVHQRSHTHSKYACSDCGACFTKHAVLAAHQKTHIK
eukprot:XP_004919968.1 PREDICTED: zinc finger protein with KRAB and SCAN domains 3-like [Xenopus tropicalis]